MRDWLCWRQTSYLLNSSCISQGTASGAMPRWQHAMALAQGTQFLVWATAWPIHSWARWPRHPAREPVCWVLSWGLLPQLSHTGFVLLFHRARLESERWCGFSSTSAARCKLCSRSSPCFTTPCCCLVFQGQHVESKLSLLSDFYFTFLCASRLSSHSSQLVNISLNLI